MVGLPHLPDAKTMHPLQSEEDRPPQGQDPPHPLGPQHSADRREPYCWASWTARECGHLGKRMAPVCHVLGCEILRRIPTFQTAAHDVGWVSGPFLCACCAEALEIREAWMHCGHVRMDETCSTVQSNWNLSRSERREFDPTVERGSGRGRPWTGDAWLTGGLPDLAGTRPPGTGRAPKTT